MPLFSRVHPAGDAAKLDDELARSARTAAAAVAGILRDGENHLATLIIGSDVVIGANAERVIQQTGGQADLPFWNYLTQRQLDSAYLLFSTKPRFNRMNLKYYRVSWRRPGMMGDR